LILTTMAGEFDGQALEIDHAEHNARPRHEPD
jgi:hypothetical protein